MGKFFMLTGGQKAGAKEGARSATEGPMKKEKKKKREKINHDGRPSYWPILRIHR